MKRFVKRVIPQVRCVRCRLEFACAELVAVPPRNGDVKGPYPKRQPLCPACIVMEARIVDSMGYVPVGEPLPAVAAKMLRALAQDRDELQKDVADQSDVVRNILKRAASLEAFLAKHPCAHIPADHPRDGPSWCDGTALAAWEKPQEAGQDPLGVFCLGHRERRDTMTAVAPRSVECPFCGAARGRACEQEAK